MYHIGDNCDCPIPCSESGCKFCMSCCPNHEQFCDECACSLDAAGVEMEDCECSCHYDGLSDDALRAAERRQMGITG